MKNKDSKPLSMKNIWTDSKKEVRFRISMIDKAKETNNDQSCSP